MKSLIFTAAAAALLAAQPAFAQPAPNQPAPSPADAQLKALYEGYADWTQKEFGFYADAKGENQPAGYLAKVDPATQQARAAHMKQLLAQLDAIPVAQLSP